MALKKTLAAPSKVVALTHTGLIKYDDHLNSESSYLFHVFARATSAKSHVEFSKAEKPTTTSTP